MSRFNTLFTVIFSLSLLTACENSDEANNIGEELVVVAGSNWYGHAPVWVGIERGIFSQYGFNVKWQYFTSSTDRLEAMARGNIQFASLGEIAMVKAMERGEKHFYWIGSQDDAPGLEGLVARTSIKTISDLKVADGQKKHRIGLPFNTSAEITGRLLLQNEGLDPENDVILVDLKAEDIPALFRSGYVDAALVWEPGFSQLQHIKGANLLATDKKTKIYSHFGTMAGPDVLILSKEWADKDINRAKRFLKAYFEALEWVRINPEKTAELAHGTYIRQDLKLITDNMKKINWHSINDQREKMSEKELFEQVNFVIEWLKDNNKIKEKPEYKQWVNLSVLPD